MIWQSTVGESARLGALKIDRLSAFLTFLVGGVGAVVFRFSERLIDECESKERFLRWLAFTVIAAYVLMLAGNLLLLVVAWSLVSVGLHELLTHYSNRPEALRPARKKFIISRLGDVALITALIVAWKTWGTWDLDLLSAKAVAEPEGGATQRRERF